LEVAAAVVEHPEFTDANGRDRRPWRNERGGSESFVSTSLAEEAYVNRRKTMNKLTMLVVAALAAATVAIGGLAAAPSASAATAKRLPGHAALPQVTVVRNLH
jgi:hypothetical protein